jgi:Uma2 family endonuclease
MATAAASVEERVKALDGQRFVLRDVDWATYRRISDALTGRHLHFAYDRGTLEFMTSSPIHARFSRLIARLITVLTEELGLPMSSCGDMTCDREDLERGIEPDECFYLNNEPLIRGKEKLDFTADPPPDLAVEIDISRSSHRRLGIYAALGVPEVWRFDGETLKIFQRGEAGQYAMAERSRHFPIVSAADLVRFLQRWSQVDENSLLRSFREWVREQITRNG